MSTNGDQIKEINKELLKKLYNDKNFISELDKVFPKATKIYKCINVRNLLKNAGIEKKFNEVFLARKPEFTFNNNKIHVYRDENGIALNGQYRSIIIICTACFIEEPNDEKDENNKNYKIVIASRLDTRHENDIEKLEKKKELEEKKELEDKKNNKMKGGLINNGKEIFDYIKTKLINGNNIKSNRVLKNKKSLNMDFINKMSTPLISNSNTTFTEKHNHLFIEYGVKSDSEIKKLKKNKVIKFTVTFSIIYDENKDIIYYSTTINQSPTYTLDDTFEIYEEEETEETTTDETEADGTDKTAAERTERTEGTDKTAATETEETKETEETEELSDRSFQTGGARGGYNRKLKRKELNTMSLNELKELHRINSIKTNSNKTVNALINNYIKNYK